MKRAVSSFAFLLSLLFAGTTFAVTPEGKAMESGKTGTTGSMETHGTPPSGTMGAAQAGERNLLSVHHLLGKNVNNHEGEMLGQINNVLIDPDSGRIAYVMLGTGGGFMAADMKLIPYQAFDVSQDQVTLVINKDKLAQVPSFSQEQGVENFDRQVVDFFGVSPYWEE